MRITLLVAGSALLWSAAVQAQVIHPPGSAIIPQVSVTGEGEAKAVPDRAMITVGVQSRGETASIAAAENARKQAAVLDTLRKMGFATDQMSTANYSVQPEMQYDQQGQRPRVIGYVVTNTVRIDVRRMEQAGQVIDAALAKGANEVHGLNFYLADPAPARRAAVANAMARARADAEALAQAAGGRLGQVLELSTAPSGPIMFQNRAMTMRAGADAEVASTPIVPGEEMVRASVSVRWAFVPNG